MPGREVEVVRAVLLLAAIGYALAPRSWLRFFLSVLLVYTAVIEGSLIAGVDTHSRFYLYVYSACTALWLFASWLVSVTYVGMAGRRFAWVLALFAGALVAHMGWQGVNHQRFWQSLVALTEGTALVVLGTALGIAAQGLFRAGKHNAYIAISLAVMWLVLGWWRVTWPEHLANPVWMEWNFVLPTLSIFAGMLLIGHWLRHPLRQRS